MERLHNPRPRRKGTCNYGACSACCRFVVLPIAGPWSWRRGIVKAWTLTEEWRQFLTVRGARFLGSHIIFDRPAREVGGRLRIDTVCPQLTPQGTCALWGKPERPMACERFPDFPEALEGLPECTFTFEGER